MDPKHCGHFPTICCYFSFLISCLFEVFWLVVFSLNLLFPFRSNILLHLTRNDRRTPKVKTKCRDLPWHLKYSKSFPSLAMLY